MLLGVYDSKDLVEYSGLVKIVELVTVVYVVSKLAFLVEGECS